MSTAATPERQAIAADRARDLVCGMTVALSGDGPEPAERTWRGRTYHFCSVDCRRAFSEHPERYVPAAVSATTGVSDGPGARQVALPVLPLNALTARSARERLGAIAGVERITADPGDDRVSVVYDAESVGIAELLEATEAAGVHTGVATGRLHVEGAFCAACTLDIERRLEASAGVLMAGFNSATDEATVVYEPRRTELGELERAVEEAGYDTGTAAAPAEGAIEREEGERASEYRSLMRKFWLSAAISVPVLILSYPWLVPGVKELGFLDRGTESLYWVWRGLAVLALPVLAWAGSQFFVGLWQGFRHRTANMHTLIAIGISAAYAYSLVAVSSPGIFPDEKYAEVYFDVTTVVTALVVLGLALEVKAKGRSSEAIKKLIGLQAKSATVIRDGEQLELPVEEVLVADIVLVRPGEKVPVDGVITNGASSLDESAVTGESMPVDRGIGEEVIGATINKTGSFEFRATKVGKDTVLANIVRMVQDAQATKLPIQRLVDRVSSIFVPAVLIAAIASFVVWYDFGPVPAFAYAVLVAVTVLIIACPCALGLATPTSLTVGMGKGAGQGILFRGGDALQAARHLDAIVLDKTGTITWGRPALTDVLAAPGFDEADVLRLASAAERNSEHPLAEAIVTGARERGIEPPKPDGFGAVPGHGVEAAVERRAVLLGNRKLMRDRGVEVADLEERAAALAADGKTPMFLAADARPAGLVAVADTIKPESVAAIRRLRELGAEVAMLTGDNERTAGAIARQVGVDRVLAEVLPEDKAHEVRKLQLEGRTVGMVGDGINDAPALTQADVGFAIGTGTDVAIEASDVTLVGGSLQGVVTAIEISQATIRNVKQNLVGAFAYHSAGLPIAAGVLYPVVGLLLSPLIAAAAMAFSSVTVVTNANRLRGWRPKGAFLDA